MRTQHIDETHEIITEPGPYPPGEGPLDYAECIHNCIDWRKPCIATWPNNGWVAFEEPDWRKEEIAPQVGFESCSHCNTSIGYTEGEYEGQYGLRLVQVWTDAWTHPHADGIALCEECVCLVEP
jgi:hypothetical protein